MAKGCCESKSEELKLLREEQGRVLKIVLALNAVMFLVEFVYGYLSGSTSLLADSLDMFGDAAVYAFSLYALERGALWRARAGLAKGWMMAFFGVFVFAEVAYRVSKGGVPRAETMGLIGAAALAVNVACLGLLYAHRRDDINMRSTWICSLNDIMANLGVIAAAWLVHRTGTAWPDIALGSFIALLFLRSAVEVVREARAEIASLRKS